MRSAAPPGVVRVMNGGVFEDIEKLEADLWEAADQLRANSKLTSSDYFMPVLGIIFLRHSANRYEAAAREIAADQAAGRMAKRRLSDADFVRRRALPLPECARYDWIMAQAASGAKDLPALVTADVEGEVTNLRLREMSEEHPQNITKSLQSLCSKGFLLNDGQGRWSSYRA